MARSTTRTLQVDTGNLLLRRPLQRTSSTILQPTESGPWLFLRSTKSAPGLRIQILVITLVCSNISPPRWILVPDYHVLDTWGMLTFKQINDISKGVYVDYKDDRMIFTKTKEWDTDFCAYVSVFFHP